ncbi:AfsR/SARP family transcriptional regulator [Sphaerisporangium aureirubrum]|uniref:BTAD domain-containing putative transcriptional regulator n=1 Tax=Sphaerisporangium aureirubrum TaxID=1544736 RepID=A0ABW1NQM5_9ACTN
MEVRFGVLGPVTAWEDGGDAIALRGPRHRAVLARLIVARRRIVPVTRLAGDLWTDPPSDPVGAVRTFVAALRRALEPGRPPRAPATLLVTEGPGYALRAGPGSVDAWRFERAVAAAATLPPAEALARLEEALGWWRGPAYAEFAAEDWARAERSRLAELRLHAVELRAETRLALGLAAEAVPDLDAHVAEHPWREDAWRLLALALYRTGRQGDALAVLRRARTLLAGRLGLDPGPRLRHLETDILRQAPHLDPGLPRERDDAVQRAGEAGLAVDAAAGIAAAAPKAAAPGDAPHGSGPTADAAQVWARAADAYDRVVASGARARLESTVGLMRSLAVTGGGGLEEARRHRVAAVAAAEELGDAELTARVIGAYDVPAIWTRVDEPEQAARVLAAAERTLADLSAAGHEAARARLLATIAVESRGTRAARGPEAARQAERLARGLDDPALLAFALNGVFMQTFHRAGLAGDRDAIGAELVALSARHGLVTFEVLGHLVRMQARAALADFATAERHATAVDHLAARNELPLAGVFTRWYRALRLAATGPGPAREAETAYRAAAAHLDGAGMPGLEHGLLPLALLSLRLSRSRPSQTSGTAGPVPGPGSVTADSTPAAVPVDRTAVPDGQVAEAAGQVTGRARWGPYLPWVRPLLLARDRPGEAAAALREIPEPPRDLLFEALWCLVARAAVAVGDRETMARARAELAPAAAELAGAGSGLFTLGPVAGYLSDLDAALRRPR